MDFRRIGRVITDDSIKRLWGLFLLAIAAGAVATWHYRNNINISTTMMALGLAAVVLTWLIQAQMRRRRYNKVWYPRQKHNFTVVNKTISYCHDSETDSVTYTRTLQIKAHIANLESYLDVFVWTGGVSVAPVAGIGCARVEMDDWRVGIWKYYSVAFDRPLKRGDIHEFSVSWVLPDWRSSSPFISASTEEPTKKLEFRIELPPKSWANTDVILETMRGIEAKYPIDYETKSLSQEGRLVWEPPTKMFRHYRMRWSWQGEPDVSSIPNVGESQLDEVKAR